MAVNQASKEILERVCAAARVGELAVLESKEKATGRAVDLLVWIHKDEKGADIWPLMLVEEIDPDDYVDPGAEV